MAKPRLALLGGSFDPLHIGHLFIAEEVRLLFGYDRILFVPAAQPPHKRQRPTASERDRLAMLRLGIADHDGFAVEPWELEQGGLSYTIDTVRHLELRYGCRLGLIIGDDLVEGYSSWKDARELATICDVMVARRHDRPLPPLLQNAAAIDNSPLAVSSSMIRERIRRGAAFRYLVPESVYAYIRNNQLYGAHQGG